MKTEVDNLINCLNNMCKLSGRKRSFDQEDKITFDDIIFILKEMAFDRLLSFDKNTNLKLKGKKLINNLIKIKQTFSAISTSFKKDPEVIKTIPEIVRLGMIAEMAICNNIINDVYIYANSNNSKSFSNCIDHFYNKMLNEKKANTIALPASKKSKKEINTIVLPASKKSEKEIKIINTISSITSKNPLSIQVKFMKNISKNNDANLNNYEDDSDYESSVDDEDGNKDKNKHKNDIVEEKDGNDDGEDGDDDDDGDEEDGDGNDEDGNKDKNKHKNDIVEEKDGDDDGEDGDDGDEEDGNGDDEEDGNGDDEDEDDEENNDDDEDDRNNIITNKESNKFFNQIFKSQNNDNEDKILKYYNNLPKNECNQIMTQIKEINNFNTKNKPILFQIMEMPLCVSQKNHIIKTYTTLMSSRFPENKLQAWFDALMTVPFGQYKGINLKNIKPKNVASFLNNLETSMNSAVYGHDEAKRQIICMVAQQIRNPKSKGNVLGIYGPPGNGKCFAFDTPILMYDGTLKMVQDIVINDIVMGDDSTPRNVLSLGSGEDEMYEIVSNNGESYTVNSEHILCLKQFKSNDISEITVKDYLKMSDDDKYKLKGYKVGVDFMSKSVDFNPYLIGFWLGGNKETLFPRITTQNPVIFSYLSDEFKKYNLDLVSRGDFNYIVAANCKTSPNMFIKVLDKYKLFSSKHIPFDYLVNDRQTRLQFLAGLIDSTGYYNKTMKNYEITFELKKLSDDLLFLVRSLGFEVKQYIITNNYTFAHNKTYYRIVISGKDLNLIPSQYPLTELNDNDQIDNGLLSEITVISKGKGKYYGFTLDGNNRFLLGNFTVTHNTSLIKDGIAKAMDKPFIFISLGGATDASFLEGHSYTYEGSIYGRIVNGLIDSKCMDPIIYFDELDKISTTSRGDEITNILVHLTDPVQNSNFRDKYFHGIDIDLSRATIIFSFNNPRNINRILIDRITTIETPYLKIYQKLHIAKYYILPRIINDIGFKDNDIIIDDNLIHYIIENWTNEGGVRKLKSLLYNIICEINIANLTKNKLDNCKVKLPFTVSQENIKKILKYKHENIQEKIHKDDKCGVINGLYASSDGSSGGIMPIEILWIPTLVPLEIKATGNLQNVIKESTHVAASLAFNHLNVKDQNKLLDSIKKRPKGLHIHCPEGATPKDGPSAGTAITCAIYSIFTGKKIKHNIAITGEINLQGQVTEIGGLENKIEGAKKAGVTLILYPKENEKDIILIKERNPTLIDDTLQTIAIETIDEALNYAIVN